MNTITRIPFQRRGTPGSGQQLARSNQQVYDLRAEKVSAVVSLVASIKLAEKLSADLAGKIERKSEMRETEVISVMNRPAPG